MHNFCRLAVSLKLDSNHILSGQWMNTHKDKIVVEGGPIGKTKAVGPNGITSITNKICGYVVVKANSHEEAAEMFKDHPHFSRFPGEGVEVMECLPIPRE